MNRTYKNLLFDADETLLDFKQDMQSAFRFMYERSGFSEEKPYSAEILEHFNTCNENWWRRYEQKLCTKPELYRNRFVDFFRAADLTPKDPEALQTLYVSGMAKTGTPLPGAIEMLQALSNNYTLYLVTNGNPASQNDRLENSGVTKFFADCFISDAVGAAKPDKAYFDYVLAHIPNAAVQNCLVLGDSLSADILGAQNAGIDSVWYNPHRKENTRGITPTFEAASFEEILKLLL